jgi:N-sulfoglucosamine sulfohydrolase
MFHQENRVLEKMKPNDMTVTPKQLNLVFFLQTSRAPSGDLHEMGKVKRWRAFLLLMIATALGGAVAPTTAQTTAAAAQRESRPNIVLFVSDDHGTDAYGAYGNSVVQTPHLDALAAEGVRFTHAFTPSASCAVSRSVLMTGLQSHRNGMYGHMHAFNGFRSFDHIRSLPVILGEAGYRTARVGKFHLAPESVYAFDAVLSPGRANDMGSIGRSPIEMADATRAFIEADDARPFFLLIASDDPHRGLPFRTAPEPNGFGNRPRGYPGVVEDTYLPENVVVPPFLPDTPEVRAELAQYYQSTSRLDQGVGRMLQILEETGTDETTVFIYLSDNGIAMPGAKTTQYEPGIRLPLVVRAPELKRGGVVADAMISWVDITPTILDFAGALKDPEAFHGRSFRPVLGGNSEEGWDEFYGSHTFHEVTMYYPMRTVRTRDYKLIWNIAHALPFPFASDLYYSISWQAALERDLEMYGQRSVDAFINRPEFELYDLNADPDEVNNLAENPKYATILAELTARLRTFQEETGDPWVVKWEYE